MFWGEGSFSQHNQGPRHKAWCLLGIYTVPHLTFCIIDALTEVPSLLRSVPLAQVV